MDLPLGLISKRVSCAPERSYCVKSALSTKAAAWRSLLKVGIFFFIGLDLLLVHLARADRPDQCLLPFVAQRKNDEHAAPIIGSADRAKATLCEWAASGSMAIGRAKRLSMTET